MSRRRRVVKVLAGVAAGALVMEALATWNTHRAHVERRHLGDRLYAEVAGTSGPAIVFLPGLQASTRYWDHRFDDLARTHRVLYLDALGFGRSPWPHEPPTLDDHLGALDRTLAAHGVTQDITLVAHSFGTVLAAHYAARHPERIRRVILLGTPVYDDEAEGRRRMWKMSPLAALFSLEPLFAREGCVFMCATRPVLWHVMPLLLPRLRPEVARDTLLHCWPTFRGALNILLTHPVAPAIARIGSKTILVHGTRDTITPRDRIEAVARAAGARAVIVDADHQGYLDPLRSVFDDPTY